jgi:hypothetical protein
MPRGNAAEARMASVSDDPVPGDKAAVRTDEALPFPESLCHQCGAPPRYIRTERSTFLYCPILKRYPPQPVRACEAFVRREDADPPPE